MTHELYLNPFKIIRRIVIAFRGKEGKEGKVGKADKEGKVGKEDKEDKVGKGGHDVFLVN